MWTLKKPCSHWDMQSEFKDLHRGGDGELYLRHYAKCRLCEWSRCHAVRLPDQITEAIDANIWAGTLEKREVQQLHTSPQAQPMSDEQIDSLISSPWMAKHAKAAWREFARAVERFHKIGG
jgi:hypothetical protein